MRAVLAASLITMASASTVDFGALFKEFKTKYGMKYSDKENSSRFEIFIRNVQSAVKFGELDQGTATFSHLSPLADRSEEEFGKLNNLPVTEQLLQEHAAKAKTITSYMDSQPDAFDWRDKGAVTAVKNQGQCGSCWAFGTVASVEGSNKLVNGELISLSEQELVDCSSSDNGCNGGLPSRAYTDMINSKNGFELETAYPYTAADGSCSWQKSLEKVFLKSWVPISTDEDQIAVALLKYGPLAIALNASPMQMYTGGISDPWFCSPSGIDHAVTLTGYGNEDGKDFWSIKNSWAATWGEQGYYRLVRGKGACGMNRMVTAAIAAPKGEAKSDDIFV